jgi:N-acetylmuramoyl-L-alanine amidase
VTKKKAAETKARQVQRASVKRAQTSSKRNTRRAPAPSPEPEIAPAIPPAFNRLFAVLLGAMAIVALVVIGGQNAPAWLAALQGRSASSGAVNVSADAPASAPTEVITHRIGIVSGHRANDSGTVCADGLTEAQVNFDIATRVASFLRADGYTVDILDEFDSRLKGYRGLLLLSIHADSCTYINDLATGFKVARALASRQPEASDHLVACLTQHYQEATQLRFHHRTVTRDMTEYHGFNELDASTPAAIIEIGFMYLDRPILTRKPELVAQGIVDGLKCFLNNEALPTAEAP